MKRTPLTRKTKLKPGTKPLKRVPVRKIRPTLRRGEPTKAEKEAARAVCFSRAKGMCQVSFTHRCPGFVPLQGDEFTRGQLAHLKSKRRFGWRESEETGQRHLWACPEGHRLQHQYGHQGEKPVPKKDKP